MTISHLFERSVQSTLFQPSALDDNKVLDQLLGNVATLNQASRVLVKQLAQEQQRCKRELQFFEQLSHRLQESMSIILGSSWMLEVHGDHIKTETKTRHYSTIVETIARLSQQLQETQALSMRQLRVGPVLSEIGKFGSESMRSYPDLAQHPMVQLDCRDFPQESAYLDPRVFRIVLDELLDNALKFSGGQKPVKCKITADDQEVHFTVRDYGIGIPALEHAEIFKPFYRAQNALDYQGTGLGLSMVRRAIAQCGGRISLKSRPGRGTKFLVMLPLNPTKKLERPPAVHSASA